MIPMGRVSHFFSNNKPGVGHWTNEEIAKFEPRKGEKILDIACGVRKIRGAIGIDNDPKSDADIVADATKLPFRKNSFDTVFCLNFLEHTFQFNEALTEIHRVMKPNGILHVEVPYYNSYNFAQTPFHHIMFCETSMGDWYTNEATFKRYTKAKFKVLETELYFTKPAMLVPRQFRIKLAHYIPNLCYQIYWKLQKDEAEIK